MAAMLATGPPELHGFSVWKAVPRKPVAIRIPRRGAFPSDPLLLSALSSGTPNHGGSSSSSTGKRSSRDNSSTASAVGSLRVTAALVAAVGASAASAQVSRRGTTQTRRVVCRRQAEEGSEEAATGRRRRKRASSSSTAEASPPVSGAPAAAVTEKTSEQFPSHLRSNEVAAGLKSGKLVRGELRMAKNSRFIGTVVSDGKAYLVKGSEAMSRACDGDLVILERLTEAQAEAQGRRRHKVLDGKSGVKEVAEAELTQSALQGTGEMASTGENLYGKIVAIEMRSQRELVGSFYPLADPVSKQGSGEQQSNMPPRVSVSLAEGERLFVPSDKRFPYVRVTPPPKLDFEGLRVAVKVSVWDRMSEWPCGSYARTMGQAGDINVETEMILMELSIKNEPFTEEVLACLPPDDFTPGPEDIKGRQDFRQVCVFSIDPPNCEDVDDALSCELLENGNFRVGVHIADVTHFIHAGTALDREAADRCTSVYLVDRRIDMLPRSLTTDICSLRCDGKDRLTFSSIFELTPEGEIVSSIFCKTVIVSKAALSYKDAQEHLDSDPAADNSEVAQGVRNLSKLAVQMRAKRSEQGALDLSSTELKFELDGESQLPSNVFQYESFSTNKLIEEFMLLANAAVAREISSQLPQFSVLRSHNPPNEEYMTELKGLLTIYGVKTFEWETNKELQKSLDNIVKDDDPFFNKLVRIMSTRCMKEANYIASGAVSPADWYHYGLAMTHYTHFTSPIRRYADVLVHRLLAASQGISSLDEVLRDTTELTAGVERLNYKNNMARKADRASVDFHLYLYFKNTGPVIAEGVVMKVTKDGMQVACEEYGAEGIAKMPSVNWLAIIQKQSVFGRPLSKFEGMKIRIFDRAVVRIEADDQDGTCRGLKMTFLGLPSRLPDGSLAQLPASNTASGEAH